VSPSRRETERERERDTHTNVFLVVYHSRPKILARPSSFLKSPFRNAAKGRGIPSRALSRKRADYFPERNWNSRESVSLSLLIDLIGSEHPRHNFPLQSLREFIFGNLFKRETEIDIQDDRGAPRAFDRGKKRSGYKPLVATPQT